MGQGFGLGKYGELCYIEKTVSKKMLIKKRDRGRKNRLSFFVIVKIK